MPIINGILTRGTPAQLASSVDILGADIYAANLAALQGFTDLPVLTIGQWGTALDTGKKYVLTIKNDGSITPHVWTEFNAAVSVSAYKESSNTTSDIYYSGLQITVAGQTTLTISHTPTSENVFFLWRNGQLQASHGSDAAQYNYSRSGMSITWNNSGPGGALATDDEIIVQYNALASGVDFEDSGNIATAWTGPSASMPTTNIRLLRTNNNVLLSINGFTAVGNGSAAWVVSPVGIVPSQFRPNTTVFGGVVTYIQPSSSGSWGRAIITSAGTITIAYDMSKNYFNPTSGQNFGICAAYDSGIPVVCKGAIPWCLV